MNYRDLFHIPEGTYLLSHSVGALPKATHASLLKHYVNPWMHKGGESWPAWLDIIETFNARLSTLLGGQPSEYCPQPNLSAGLARYLGALRVPETRREVLMHADAFPSMAYATGALQKIGFEPVLIPQDLSASDPQIWADALTDRTAAILITHVHSNTGVLSPVSDIIAAIKDKDVRIMVDIAQSAGIIPMDIAAWGAAAVFGSCVKWLCGGPGAGFMWVRGDTIPDLHPQEVGWFSHENPFEFDIRNFRYAPDAKRFWGGTPSVAPYAAAAGSLEIIADISVETIGAHNLACRNIIAPETNHIGQGGTLCLSFGDRTDAATQTLDALNVRFDRRGDTLRLSFHIYNSTEEAASIAAALSGF